MPSVPLPVGGWLALPAHPGTSAWFPAGSGDVVVGCRMVEPWAPSHLIRSSLPALAMPRFAPLSLLLGWSAEGALEFTPRLHIR